MSDSEDLIIDPNCMLESVWRVSRVWWAGERKEHWFIEPKGGGTGGGTEERNEHVPPVHSCKDYTLCLARTSLRLRPGIFAQHSSASWCPRVGPVKRFVTWLEEGRFAQADRRAMMLLGRPERDHY